MVTGLLSFQDGALNADQGGNGGPPVISGRSNTVGGSQPGGIGGPAALGPAEIRKEIAYMQKQEKVRPRFPSSPVSNMLLILGRLNPTKSWSPHSFLSQSLQIMLQICLRTRT